MNPAPLRWLAAGCRRARRLGLAMALCLSGIPAVQAAPPAACPAPPPPLSVEQVQQGLREARDHGYLWRLRKDGRESWLYGTLHVARQPWMFPGPRTLSALRSADRVALELDLLDPAIVQRLQALVAAVPGQAPLPLSVARRLATQAEAACVAGQLDGLRPEMQAVTLMSLIGRADGLDPVYGIDNFLAGLAHGLKKPVISLETPEAQVSLLVSSDTEARDKTVTTLLDELERGDAQRVMLRLALAWADGRMDDLDNYAQWCQCLDTEEQRDFHRRLIDERNLALARRIDAVHEAGHTVFAAVGALHMAGPQALPRLMAERGYTVERVEPAR